MTNKKLFFVFFIFFGFFVWTNSIFSQENNQLESENSNFLNTNIQKANIRTNGYFRYLGYVRNFSDMYDLDIPNYYSGVYPQPTTISIGTGYREPMMMLSLSAKPHKSVNVSTDLMLNSSFDGNFDNNQLSLYLGTNVYSTIKTNFANFGLHAGGIKWYRQSKLTVWAEEGYLRYSLFERAPYDPLTKNVEDRYSKYYDKGSISQDLRFGNIAFHGLTFNANGIKSFKSSTIDIQSIIGKTQNNIGEIVSKGQDDYSTGIRIANKFSNNNFAFNYFKSITATDSVKQNYRSFDMNSFEYDFNLNSFKFYGELGIGSYKSHKNKKDYGEAIVLNFSSKNSLLPVHVQLSRISPEAVNINSSFQNTSVVDLVNTTVIEEGAEATILNSFGGPINNLGYLANNRQGISVNLDKKIQNFQISCGLGVYSEIERINNSFSFNHNIAGTMLSRISYFSTGYGPYKQFNSYYRGVYENIDVVDSNFVEYELNIDTTISSNNIINIDTTIHVSNVLFDKYYTSADLHIKYKMKVLNRDLYLFSLTQYNTAQDFLSFTPVIDKKAFVRHLTQHLDFCYKLTDNTTFVGKYGIEKIIANDYTLIDDTDPYPNDFQWGVEEDYLMSYSPKNHTNKVLGLGFDIKIKNGTYLFFRHSNYKIWDKNFRATNIKASETTIELKINF